MGQTPRDYQVRGIEALRACFRENIRKLLLVAPTGAGKTTIAAVLIENAVAKGGHVLVIAHRKELIDQCSKRLDGAGVDHGIMMGNHPRYRPEQPVQVASIQTLARRMGQLPHATIVIVDEGHHARADTYGAVMAHYVEKGAVVIALTATPWRSDNKGLAECFDAVVVVTTPKELIALGFLVPYVGFAYRGPNMKGVRKAKGDYDQKQMDERISKDTELAGAIISEWTKHAEGRRTIVFCCSIRHSQDMRDRFIAAGIRAEHVDGTTDKEEREAILARFSRGETTVVCNCNVLTEGFDEPRAEVCVLARPTLSLVLALQMPGRVLRPACRACGLHVHPAAPACAACGSTDIKRQARIHDHAGVFIKHGLPDDDRDYTLEQDKPPKPDPVKQCRKCFCTYRGNVCPMCGADEEESEAASQKEVVEVAPVEVIPLKDLIKTAAKSARTPVEYHAQLMRIAKERGYAQGWVGIQYNLWLRFGGAKRMADRANNQILGPWRK